MNKMASEIGSMTIKASMDTTSLDNAMNRVVNDLENTKKSTRSLTADMERLAKVGERVAQGMIAIGGAASAGLIKAALASPALAGAMSKIEIQLMKMSFALGEGLRPVMTWLGNQMEKIAGFAQGNPTLFAGIVTALTTIAGLGIVGKLATTLGILEGATVSSALMGFLGAIAAPAVLTALALLAAIKIGEGLANEFMVDGVNVPIPQAAQDQIKKTQGTAEGYELSSRYALDPFAPGGGGGAEQSVQIDIATGELYVTRHMGRDAAANAQDSEWFLNIMDSTTNKSIQFNITSGIAKGAGE